MNPKRCHYMAVSESCLLHDSSFGVRSFTKSELASQSNVRSCANLSGYKPIHGTFCVVLQSHFLLCKALNPEGQIVRIATFACIPKLRKRSHWAVAETTADRHPPYSFPFFNTRWKNEILICFITSLIQHRYNWFREAINADNYFL